MSDQFVAEIRIFPFNFAPVGWALCNGQLLPISQYAALFSLIGTFYGGNGTSNFALPNLQGAAPLNFGQGSGLSLRNIGQTGGETAVTLLTSQLPAHNHAISASTSPGTTTTANGNQLGVGQSGGGKSGQTVVNLYSPNPAQAKTGLAANSMSNAGGSLSHNNLQPYLTFNFCIALQGIYPSRS
ncbi:phage tail protein [Rhodoblastus sp.]|uniref:phage tail protein n=1 Tax=Rhodoblastus sp. TaxID=1962975 RepID=UPI003F94F205